MGRKDLTELRSEQILAAFERCVARFGLEGSSLERVAQEAGVKRSLIRHYIGNRDALIAALAERAVRREAALVSALIEALPQKNRIEALITLLFADDPEADAGAQRALDVLIGAAESHPRCRKLLSGFVRDFTAALRGELDAAFPESAPQARNAVAWGLVSLCLSFEGLRPLELGEDFRASSGDAARRLVRGLGPF